jgi:hypothetical protein
MTVADSAALDIISADVLSDAVVALAVDKLMALFDVPAEDLDGRRRAIANQLRKVEKELSHLQGAVAAGDPLDTLLQAAPIVSSARDSSKPSCQGWTSVLHSWRRLGRSAFRLRACASAEQVARRVGRDGLPGGVKHDVNSDPVRHRSAFAATRLRRDQTSRGVGLGQTKPGQAVG